MDADRASLEDVRALTDAVERLRLAEARLGRQRAGRSGLNNTDRAAVRLVSEFGDDGTDVTPGMIASRLHLSRSSVTTLLDRLVAKGMLSVSRHPSDRRSKLVVPTDRSIEPDRIDPLTARLREISASLTPRAAATITRYLDLVTDAVRVQGAGAHASGSRRLS